MSSSRRELGVNSFWSLLTHVLWRGSLMAASVILARSLRTSDFAAYSYFQLTATMFATYASLGLGVSASKFFAVAGHERADERPAPLGTLVVLSVGLSAVLALVILVMPRSLLNVGLGVPVWMIAIGAASVALGVVPNGAILGCEKYAQAAMISAVSGGIILAGTLWAGLQHAPIAAMACFVIGSLVQAGGQFWIAGRTVGWGRMSVGLRPRRADVTHIVAFAGPMMMVSVMAGTGSWIVGRLILSGVSGAHAFALYSIGMQWFALTLLLPGMVSRVLFPRMIRVSRDSSEEPARLTRSSMQLATLAGFGVFLVGAVFSPLLMRVYGSGYSVSGWFIAVYMAAGLVNAPLTTLGNSIVATDGQRAWMWITIAWFAVLVLTALVTLSMGAAGWTGAIAQGLSNSTQLFIAAAYARRRGLV